MNDETPNENVEPDKTPATAEAVTAADAERALKHSIFTLYKDVVIALLPIANEKDHASFHDYAADITDSILMEADAYANRTGDRMIAEQQERDRG